MFGDTDGGGGFFNADTSFGGGSPQVSKKPDQKRAQNIMPVTALQVLSCPEDGLRIGNIDVYLVTLVGIVKSVENTSVKITYFLEDDTGCIEGAHWIDGDEGNQTSQPVVIENTYCRLSGTIRSQSEKRYIMVFNIHQLKDLNEITSHRLEVALFSKKAEIMANGVEPVLTKADKAFENNNSSGNGLSNSLMPSTSHTTAVGGLTQTQQYVLQVIQQCTLDSGINIKDIEIQNNMSQDDIQKAVEFLCGEGHIYSTIDECHYRTTE